MTRVYYKEAAAALVVFDLTRAGTFDGVAKWKSDLDAKVTLADGRPVPAVLLAQQGHTLALSISLLLRSLHSFLYRLIRNPAAL